MTDIVITGSWGQSIKSSAAAYADARAGSGTKALISDRKCGQYRKDVTSDYEVYQSFAAFDLSTVDPALVLTAAKFSAAPYLTYLYYSTAWTVELYRYDYYSVDIGDFVPGANISSYTKYASVLASAISGLTDFTSEAAFLSALQYGEDRPSTLYLMLVSARQRTNNSPSTGNTEWLQWDNSVSKPTLTLTHSGAYRKVFLIEAGFSVSDYTLKPTFTVELATQVRCRYRASTPRPQAGTVRAYDHNRVLVGVLPGEVQTVNKLDGPDELSLFIPYRYGKMDGTTESRLSMITGGWYLEHRDHWYRIENFSPKLYKNQLPVKGLSAEVELEDYLTNYGQVPFNMPSHTPTEIATALLSGLPECDWYNGDFAELDDTGFPVGWTPDSASNWQAYSGEGEPTVEAYAYAGGVAELASFGISHTSGAEIKPKVDVWVEEDFAGSVDLILSWQNSAGVESYSETLPITGLQEGEWITFEDSTWRAVRNERCVLKLKVTNTDALRVRFRSARFVQNEDSTGWVYYGSMDARDTAVAYNDAAFQQYGTWTLDAVNSLVYSTTAGDVLARAFTGDLVTVNFAAGGAGALADILVDGVAKVSNLSVASAVSYQITGLNKYRSHALEIVVKAVKVSVSGLTVSHENRIAATWNRGKVYDALRELKTLVGGEFWFDTASKTVWHDPTQGEDLTAANILWLREGKNLSDFEPETVRGEIANRLYYGGHGDGAFQVGVKVDSTATSGGSTSQALYGIKRFSYTNKDVKDLASATAEALEKVEEKAFPQNTWSSKVPDDDAAYMIAGDTVQVTAETLGTEKLRALQISRSSKGGPASVLWGDRITLTDPAAQSEAVRRSVEKLLHAH